MTDQPVHAETSAQPQYVTVSADDLRAAVINVNAAATIAGRRGMILGAGGIAAALVSAFTVARLLPLKQRVPFMIEEDPNTGRVTISKKATTEFVIKEKNKVFYLRDWIRNLFTIDSKARVNVSRATKIMVGKAGKRWDEYADTQKIYDRAAKGEQRDIERLTVNLTGPETALIRFGLKDGSQPIVWYALTITFVLLVPEKEADVDDDNPLGLTITEFDLRKELNQ